MTEQKDCRNTGMYLGPGSEMYPKNVVEFSMFHSATVYILNILLFVKQNAKRCMQKC